MKHTTIKQILAIMLIAGTPVFVGCSDPDYMEAVPNTTASGLTTNVLFVNASPTAPSLDLFINGLKAGTSLTFGTGHTGYTTVPLTSTIFSGGSASATANTNIRAKASSGTIGGVLGSSDLVYRAGNNNSNNFVAADGARYTLFALDTIARPKPIRTLNAAFSADTTFFNPLTGAYISTVEKAALQPAERANVVPIGTVPLGASDPGGLRFLLLTDTYPIFAGGNSTQAGIRFINTSPNGGNLFVRLRPAAGANITLATGVGYALSFPTLSPSVGSRATTAATFTLRSIAVAGVPIVYNLEISTDALFTSPVTISNVTFNVDKVYTVYVNGLKGALSAGIVLHNP